VCTPRGNIRVALAVVAVCAGGPVSAALAQDAPRNAYEIAFENDIFIGIVPGKPHSDREYTHGLWIAEERSDAPLWGSLFSGIPTCEDGGVATSTCLQTRFEVGQKIFTPHIREEIPSPTERPYAGWLYGSATARAVRTWASRSLRVELGVTGPPSLAEPFQKGIHRVTRYPQPKGWDHQLAFEPGVLLRYDERRLVEHVTASGRRVADAIVTLGATAGNVRIGVDGSVAVRAGSRLPHPWLRGTGASEPSGFVTLEVRRLWTARDLFLDGNTFTDGPRVERIASTGEVRVGAAVEYADLWLEFTHVLEDKLYTTQPRPHRYSRLALVLHR